MQARQQLLRDEGNNDESLAGGGRGFRVDLGVLDEKWRQMRNRIMSLLQSEQNEVKYRMDLLENESDDETWQTVVHDESECKLTLDSKAFPNLYLNTLISYK